jgi:hypothetical protein
VLRQLIRVRLRGEEIERPAVMPKLAWDDGDRPCREATPQWVLIRAVSASVVMLLIEKSKRGLRLAKVLVVLQRSPENCEAKDPNVGTTNPRPASVEGCRSIHQGIDVETAGIDIDTLGLAPGMGPHVSTNISPMWRGRFQTGVRNSGEHKNTRKCADG